MSRLCSPSSGATRVGVVSQPKVKWQIWHADLAQHRMILFNNHAARDNLRVSQDFVDALHLGTGDVNRVECRKTCSHRGLRRNQARTSGRISARWALRPGAL